MSDGTEVIQSKRKRRKNANKAINKAAPAASATAAAQTVSQVPSEEISFKRLGPKASLLQKVLTTQAHKTAQTMKEPSDTEVGSPTRQPSPDRPDPAPVNVPAKQQEPHPSALRRYGSGQSSQSGGSSMSDSPGSHSGVRRRALEAVSAALSSSDTSSSIESCAVRLTDRKILAGGSMVLRLEPGVKLPAGKMIRISFPKEGSSGSSRPHSSCPGLFNPIACTEACVDVLVTFQDLDPCSAQLRNLQLGDEVTVTCPFGVYEVKPTVDHIAMVAEGKGVAPMLQVMRSCLDSVTNETRISALIYGESADELILWKKLEDYSRKSVIVNKRMIKRLTSAPLTSSESSDKASVSSDKAPESSNQEVKKESSPLPQENIAGEEKTSKDDNTQSTSGGGVKSFDILVDDVKTFTDRERFIRVYYFTPDQAVWKAASAADLDRINRCKAMPAPGKGQEHPVPTDKEILTRHLWQCLPDPTVNSQFLLCGSPSFVKDIKKQLLPLRSWNTMHFVEFPWHHDNEGKRSSSRTRRAVFNEEANAASK